MCVRRNAGKITLNFVYRVVIQKSRHKMARIGSGFQNCIWIILCGLSVFAQVNNTPDGQNETVTEGYVLVNSPATQRSGLQDTVTLSTSDKYEHERMEPVTSPSDLESENTELSTDGQLTHPAPILQVGQFELTKPGTTQVCLKAWFALVFKIYYKSKKAGEKQASISLPAKADVGGACTDDGLEPILTLQWKEAKYELKFTFGTDYSLSSFPMWEVRRIQFTYDMSDKDHFDDPVHPGIYTVHTSEKSVYFKTPLEFSRICKSEDDITLRNDDGEEVVMEITHLQLQPYDIRNNSFSESKRCKSDMTKKNNVASVVVGLILAVTILIVIAAYAVGRKIGLVVDGPKYNTME